MTAKDSADGLLENIAAAGATTVHSFANFLLDGCGLTRAGADLQQIGNLGNGDGLIHIVKRNSNPVSTKPFKLFESVFNESRRRRLPKENANQINKEENSLFSDPRTKKRAKVTKRAVSAAAATVGIGQKHKRWWKSDDVLEGCRHEVDEFT